MTNAPHFALLRKVVVVVKRSILILDYLFIGISIYDFISMYAMLLYGGKKGVSQLRVEQLSSGQSTFNVNIFALTQNLITNDNVFHS